jgi:hypothetical protein
MFLKALVAAGDAGAALVLATVIVTALGAARRGAKCIVTVVCSWVHGGVWAETQPVRSSFLHFSSRLVTMR